MIYLETFADGDRGSLNGVSVFSSVISIKGSLKTFFVRCWMLLIGLTECKNTGLWVKCLSLLREMHALYMTRHSCFFFCSFLFSPTSFSSLNYRKKNHPPLRTHMGVELLYQVKGENEFTCVCLFLSNVVSMTKSYLLMDVMHSPDWRWFITHELIFVTKKEEAKVKSVYWFDKH